MYYEIPKEKPQPQERPRPIFPWERDHDMPKPTRVFADDSPPPPLPKIPSTTAAEESATIPPLEPPEILEPVPFIPQPNAWDNVQSIERYVRAVMDAQTRRTKPSARAPEDVVSPPAARPPGRRESLILTDFPTADDRPSLPVTPAPIRRPTFWGSERDDEGNLPVAEGVPDQADWVCPQCGFVASSPTAFYRPHRKSSAGTSSTARQQVCSSSEIPPLPSHLRFHRTSSSEHSWVSSTSTAVPPSAATVTASAKDVPASSSAVLSPEEEELKHGGAVLDVLVEEARPTLARKLSPDIWQQLS